MKFNKKYKTIEMNRGESAFLKIKRKNGNFSIGDKIKFSILENGNYDNVLFQKELTIEEESAFFYFPFEPNDTRFNDLNPKNEEVYWYELELNNSIPLIAFDEDGGKEFVLYPEAPDKEVTNNE